MTMIPEEHEEAKDDEGLEDPSRLGVLRDLRENFVPSSQEAKHPEGQPAVLLDRDGVLNRDSDDFIKSPEELVLLPGAAEAVARLNRAGFVTPVITNQSGIGRGLFASDVLDQIHAKLIEEVQAAGGRIERIYACPHRPDDGCACRKPKPAMILQAERELGLDLSRSWYVGDKKEDVLCGQSAGVRTILVLTGKTREYDPALFSAPPDHVAANLSEATDYILRRS